MNHPIYRGGFALLKRIVIMVVVLVLVVFGLSIPLRENTEWKIINLDGYVVVYDPSGLLYEITDISVSRLPLKEQQDLALGVKVKDVFELEKILDGLSQ